MAESYKWYRPLNFNLTKRKNCFDVHYLTWLAKQFGIAPMMNVINNKESYDDKNWWKTGWNIDKPVQKFFDKVQAARKLFPDDKPINLDALTQKVWNWTHETIGITYEDVYGMIQQEYAGCISIDNAAATSLQQNSDKIGSVDTSVNEDDAQNDDDKDDPLSAAEALFKK